MAEPAPLDVLEALLFASDTPLEAERIREVIGLGEIGEATALVEELRARIETSGRGLQVTEVGGGYRMVTRPEMAPWLVRLARTRTRARLSRPAVETLAIVGYRQPVSRPEIDAIRGVNSEGVLESLLERRLVRISGRKDAPGRPFLYETTREFLVAFGLRDVKDLPKVEGELIVPDLGVPQSTNGAENGAENAENATDSADSATDDAGTPIHGAAHADAPEAADDDASQAEQAPGASGPHVETGR